MPSIALVWNCPPLSCKILRLRKKIVSVRLILVESLILFSLSFFFFFNKCFPLVGMTTKFNQGMYTRMRAKRNKPLSNLRTTGVRVMEKGNPVTTMTLPTPVIESVGIASPATSVEEIPPQRKRQRTGISRKRKLTLDFPMSRLMPGLC